LWCLALLGAPSLRGVWSAVTHTHDEPAGDQPGCRRGSLEPCKDGRAQSREATVQGFVRMRARRHARYGLCSRRPLCAERVAVWRPCSRARRLRRLCSGDPVSRLGTRQWYGGGCAPAVTMEIDAAAYGSFVTRLTMLGCQCCSANEIAEQAKPWIRNSRRHSLRQIPGKPMEAGTRSRRTCSKFQAL
jgi:hypothetical protein